MALEYDILATQGGGGINLINRGSYKLNDSYDTSKDLSANINFIQYLDELVSIKIENGKLYYLDAVGATGSTTRNNCTIQIPESTWVTNEFYEWFQSAYSIDDTSTKGVNIISAGTYYKQGYNTAALPWGLSAKINFITSNGENYIGMYHQESDTENTYAVQYVKQDYTTTNLDVLAELIDLDLIEFTIQEDTLVNFAFYDWFNATFKLGTVPTITAGTYYGVETLPSILSTTYLITGLNFTANGNTYNAVIAGTVSLSNLSVNGLAYTDDILSAMQSGTNYVNVYTSSWDENYRMITLSEDSKILPDAYPYFPYIYTKIE